MLKDKGMLMSNKGGNVAVVLLVLMTVVLVGASLFIFNVNSNKIGTEIADGRFLNEIYFDENKMDFYINEIMEEVVEDLVVGKEVDGGGGLVVGGVDGFVEDFKVKLGEYKGKKIIPEFDKIEEQISSENVEIGEDFVSMKFSIRMERQLGGMNVAYLYDKELVRGFG